MESPDDMPPAVRKLIEAAPVSLLLALLAWSASRRVGSLSEQELASHKLDQTLTPIVRDIRALLERPEQMLQDLQKLPDPREPRPKPTPKEPPDGAY